MTQTQVQYDRKRQLTFEVLLDAWVASKQTPEQVQQALDLLIELGIDQSKKHSKPGDTENIFYKLVDAQKNENQGENDAGKRFLQEIKAINNNPLYQRVSNEEIEACCSERFTRENATKNTFDNEKLLGAFIEKLNTVNRQLKIKALQHNTDNQASNTQSIPTSMNITTMMTAFTKKINEIPMNYPACKSKQEVFNTWSNEIKIMTRVLNYDLRQKDKEKAVNTFHKTWNEALNKAEKEITKDTPGVWNTLIKPAVNALISSLNSLFEKMNLTTRLTPCSSYKNEIQKLWETSIKRDIDNEFNKITEKLDIKKPSL